jgi:Family of unknown function (DUF5755)
MGKKCIPGLFCVENMTLFLLFVILVLVVYFYHIHMSNAKTSEPSKVIIVNQPPLGAIATRQDPMNNPYSPPMKSDSIYYPPNSGDIRGMVPVNIETRGLTTSYQQVGILTRNRGGDMILPLMGRRNMAGRDKWQYYTISNTGNLNTKLPISVNGKSCTSEYGCDSISNGDTVYVEGYNDTFRATVYETSTFQYLPQL